MEPGECRSLCDRLNPRWHLNPEADRLLCSLGISGSSRNAIWLFRKIGELSERENHHPELRWFQERLDIELWTHKIGALVESDFILADKIDAILEESGIPVESFDAPCRKGGTPAFSGTYRGWHIVSGKEVLCRRFSFADFRHPWEYALGILDLDGESLAVDLGFGHLEVEVGGPHGRDLADKISQLME